MCLSGRDLTEPRISPDGSTVVFVARWGSSTALVAVPVGGGAERIVTTDPAPAPGRGLGGGCWTWTPDGREMIYVARDGNLWRQPASGGPPSRVTDVAEGRRCEAPTTTPDGTSVLAAIDQAEIWMWSLTGEQEPKRLDDGTADFVFDPHVVTCGSDAMWMAWSVPDMPWDSAHVDVVGLDDGSRRRFRGAGAIQQPTAMPDGRALWIRDDSGWLNVWLEDEPLVDEAFEHAGPTWGMGQRSCTRSPDGSHVVFTRNERGFGRLCVVDVATGAVRQVARGVHGQLSWEGDSVVALRSGARTPTQIVRYDTTTWDRTVLAIGPVAGWEAADLPEPELVDIDRDGVVLHARRFVAGEGRTICWVHGGPTDQWQVEFMPRIAYWWSRGWDVLVPDPRGSTGHGRSYQQALRGEWGRLDVDDAAAILAASHAAETSDPARTVLMGSSSGGLTALGVLAHHPGLAVGGVVLYPVSDLTALADESHRFEAYYTASLVGPRSDLASYEQRSPLTHAANITDPLLVMHGDADPVVPLSSSVELVDRIRMAGGDAELVVYQGEGHGFRDPVNKRDEYRRTAEFLSRVVGDG